MTEPEAGAGGTPKRRPGRPRTIDRKRILDVARNLDPNTVTMQAVANELGVNRKSLSYHVTDRDGLMRMIAADAFAARFNEAFGTYLDSADSAHPGDWRNAIRAWAFAVRDSVVAAGVAVSYFRITEDDPAIFGTVELVLQRMIAAGFDVATAGRGMVFLTRFAMGVGRDIVLENQSGAHPQDAEVRRALDDQVMPDQAAFRWMVSAGLNSTTDIATQFDFEIDVFLDGMQQRRGAAG